MKRTTCKIISDASYDHLTGKCGYGVIILMKDLCIFKYGSIRGAKSSSEAEVLAAKKGIDYLQTKEFAAFNRPVKKVVLLSDSFVVRAFDPREGDKLGKYSPRDGKKRLRKTIDAMREACSKYERGYEAYHIRGHQELTALPDKEKGYYHKVLEYKYNQWCDQSARKNLRYNLKGKKVVHCNGFPSPEKYVVEVPEGAFLARKESLAQNLQ